MEGDFGPFLSGRPAELCGREGALRCIISKNLTITTPLKCSVRSFRPVRDAFFTMIV